MLLFIIDRKALDVYKKSVQIYVIMLREIHILCIDTGRKRSILILTWLRRRHMPYIGIKKETVERLAIKKQPVKNAGYNVR